MADQSTKHAPHVGRFFAWALVGRGAALIVEHSRVGSVREGLALPAPQKGSSCA